jgi:pyridoxamine 5'-phosphate oxidase
MTLATASSGGRPSARVVLLKGFDERGFVFYTNYEGRKARDLEENPYCALVFYWGELERQVRVEGSVLSRFDGGVRRILSEQAAGKPVERLGFGAEPSRCGAGCSGGAAAEARDEYEGRDVQRPPFWGGYRVEPEAIEFWQGRENRLHDRLLYRCSGDGRWSRKRLQP